jgi:indolepyruvate ferredoxin oxidoreductase beta subunit
MKTSECDIVIVGVGGQGVILMSEVLGLAAVMANKSVRGAETHGMAQRGGSVVNHIRIGCKFGPMVAPGCADVLLALEPAEALRFGHFLSSQGVCLVNTQPILPITVTTGQAKYPPLEKIFNILCRISPNILTIEATALSKQAGMAQAMNSVMLGALSKYIPLPEEALLTALCKIVPPRFMKVNKEAFALGKAEVE